MRENALKAIWARGDTVINGWLAIPSAFSAEVMAHQGFDSLTVDMQHGVVDYQAAVTMLQAISTTPTVPLARVPWNDPGFIMKVLDAGVFGLICPMINTRADAEALVRSCKYPPLGYRSFGPVRASIYAGPDYADRANADVLVIPMIETKQAVENLDDILSVSGIDAVYIGPADLSFALGLVPRGDNPDPTHLATCDKILKAAHQHGIKAVMHCASAAFAAGAVKRGFDMVMLTSDLACMIAGARLQLDELKAKTA